MLRNWLAAFRAHRSRSPRQRVGRSSRPANRRLVFERFESRSLLATLSVVATDAWAVEGESTGSFVFSRDGSLTSAVSVNYSVGGTATAGSDYLTLSGSVTIPAGQASVSVPVVPLPDGAAETPESVSVTLASVAGYTVDLASATVLVRDAFDGADVFALVPLSETFALHSLPGARHTVYLDFDGGAVNDPAWSSSTINVNPFSLDAVNAFSDSELATIQRTWEVVAEDFRPFGVDVTTELPDIERLRKTGTGDTEWGIRVMIGDPIEYSAGATGRAMDNSFNANYDAVAWVDLSSSSWGGDNNKSARTIGGLISHEVGHSMNLHHDGTGPADDASYYAGHGAGETSWTPIMGNVFSNWVATWSRGDYPNANQTQDDLAVLTTTNGYTYRPDDHADAASLATPLVALDSPTGSFLLAEGLIERNTDADWFSFASSGGTARISVEPASYNPNLDLQAELYDAGLNLIATAAPVDQLAAGLQQSLAAGTYFVRVTSSGNRTWSTGGYDNYASLGAYAVRIGGPSTVASFFPAPGQNSTPITGRSTLPDITLSTLTRVGVSGGTNSSSLWPLYWSASATQNTSAYITFTVTPTAGRLLDAEELVVGLRAYSVSTVSSVALRSSLDGFAANLDGVRAMNANGFGDLAFDLGSLPNAAGPVEFRLYVWGNSTGYRDLRNLSLTGRTIDGSPVAPVANGDSATTNQATPVTISVLANDTDANGDALTVARIATPPAHGTATIHANGTVTYAPVAGYLGGDSFAYVASDGGLESSPAVVTLTVVAVNTPPVATNDSATTNEDTNVTIAVLANDTDAESDPLVPSLVAAPAHGTATVNANGTIAYVPAANYSGSDSFTYRISDGTANSSPATVNLTIIAVNDAPVAVNDSATTTEATPVTIAVLANDTDVDGPALTPSIVTPPAHGTATVNANGTITYVPAGGYFGSDAFAYVVSDGAATSNPATVSLTVSNVPQTLARFDPVGAQGSGSVAGTTAVAGVTVGSLSRAGAGSGTNTNVWPVSWSGSTTLNPAQYVTFPVTAAGTWLADFSRLTVSFQEWVTGTSSVAVRSSLDGFAANVGGTQTLADTGSADVTFDLASLPAVTGTTTFRIYVFDSVDGTSGWRDIRSSAWNNGQGVWLEGRTVPNAAPVAGHDAASTAEDMPVTIGVLANDADADSNSLVPTILTPPAHGTATVNANGTITFVPAAHYFGADEFTYRVSDGGLTSNTATVGLNVTAVNDAPTAVADAFATDFGATLNVGAASGVLANDGDVDGDVDGDARTASLVSGPSHGQLTLNADGSFQFMPAAGFAGTDTFRYSVSDGQLAAQADVSIAVNPPPDDHGDLPDATATPLSLSGGGKGQATAAGAFEVAGDRDVFRVTVATGSLTVGLTGPGDLDTYLRVYSAAGTQIGADDDSGPGVGSQLTLSVSAGTYYLSAGTYADSYAGSFTLTVDHREKVARTFQPGVSGYSGASDTHVSSAYPTTSFATWTMNQVDYTSATAQEQSLLQFQNLFGSGAGQIPYGSEITSATLTLYVTNGGNRVNFHRLLLPWTDAATWNTFGGGIQANGVEALAAPDAQTASYVATGWQTLDVKTSLVAWLANPAANFGWAMLPTGTDGVDWYSSNNGSSWVPRLSVEYFIPSGDLHANQPPLAATPLAATPLAVTNNYASVFGTLETAGDRDVFQFTLTKSRSVTLQLTGTGSTPALDTYLRLYDATGLLLGENDNYGTGSSSRLSLTLAAGTYLVSAGSRLDLSLGDFRLEVSLT